MRHAFALTVLIVLTSGCDQTDTTGNSQLGLENSAQPVPEGGQPPQRADQAGEIGRFVIVHSPHVENDTVLLDTVTGKTWLQVENASRAAILWEAMPRSDNTAEMESWEQDHPVKSKSAALNPKAPWEKEPPVDSSSYPQKPN